MHRHGRRFLAGLKTFSREKRYGIDEALGVLGAFPKAKFDETVELAIRLGTDPGKTDQSIRGSISLPKGIGKARSVVVFAEGELAKQCTEAGAVAVGAADLAKRIEDGWTDFDVAIAHPSMMRFVGKLGKVLGPLGKMPSPKAGTVTDNVVAAVREFRAGKIEFRSDPAGNLHVGLGKRSFAAADLKANIEAFIEHVRGLRPASVKGTFIRKVVLSSTMSPGVILDVQG
ncbi:MAG: 50S ribosomal protein L1 [Planctomycetes bacterium]|nr:50S ribosomal protein L1 [Planctomycetota bacterium]